MVNETVVVPVVDREVRRDSAVVPQIERERVPYADAPNRATTTPLISAPDPLPLNVREPYPGQYLDQRGFHDAGRFPNDPNTGLPPSQVRYSETWSPNGGPVRDGRLVEPLTGPQRGDVVLYSEGGKVYNAIVLLSHLQNDAHKGQGGEPTLHLAVLFDEVRGKTQPIGYIPQVTVVHDVVHASQVFSPRYRSDNGLLTAAQVAERRGAGEWREAAVSAPAAQENTRTAKNAGGWHNAGKAALEPKKSGWHN